MCLPLSENSNTYFLTTKLNCAASRENLSSGFPTSSDTNRAVHTRKVNVDRGLKFRIKKDERVYYLRSENRYKLKMSVFI